MVKTIVKRGAIACAALVGVEALYAVLKPAPDLEQFDPTAEFGDPSDPELRVVVVGDSSVTAPGVAGPEEIWISLVCEGLARNRRVRLFSFAVGGAMAHNLIADQLEPAKASRPDIVFLSVGANDVIKGVSPRRFAANLDQLVGELKGTGALVVQSGVGVLGTIPRLYPPLSHLMSRRALRFDRIHHRVAEKHGTVVADQRDDDVRIWQTDRSLWAADHFHVSAEGHKRWADMVWRTVGRHLESHVG